MDEKRLKLALIGKDVSQSDSERIHRFILSELGVSCEYEKVSVSAAEFDFAVRRLLGDFDGFNVTIPYKRDILEYLDGFLGDALEYGAVNTVVSATRQGYNTDGVDIVNSQNVTLKNSFIHSFDDTVTVKGIEAYRDTDNLHILIENCTLVCDWGRACEIGLETNCKLYDDITFRNCDVLHGGFAAMDIQNGDYAEVRNIRFEDIRVEYEKFHRPEIQQRKEDDVYTGVNDTIFSYLLNVTNLRSPCNAVKIDAEKMGLPAAQVHDIFLKDIAVYYDDTIPLKEGKRQIPVQVENLVNGVTHYNIFIENVTVNGEKYTKDDALLYLDSVENFVWKE